MLAFAVYFIYRTATFDSPFKSLVIKEIKLIMFILSCESTADLPYEYLQKRNIPAISYTYSVDGTEYADDMGQLDGRKQFYKFLSEGKLPLTSQICEDRYMGFFRTQLEKGDLLHIALDSSLSQSIFNAYSAANKLKKEFPKRKIVIVDSTCGCLGYGILVDYLADMRDAGNSFDELYDWAKANKRKIHHQFFSTTLSYYRRSGRITGPAMLLGNLLKLCPLLRLDKTGKIIAYSKVMSVNKAIGKTLEETGSHIQDGSDYNGKLWVAHSDCEETAQKVVEQLKQLYKNADIRLFEIGPIIGAHCGAGTVAVYFMGDERVS